MGKQRSSPLATLIARLGRSKPVEREKPAGRFQAIAIFRGAQCCDMARRFSEHRFLAKDVPPLPLQQCTMADKCTCTYLRFKDRRGVQRRAVDFGSAARSTVRNERRSFKGRRVTD